MKSVGILILYSVMLLGGCSASTQTTDVAAVAVSLTAAEQAALAYVSLPRCGATAPAFPGAPEMTACSDPKIVADIKAQDMAAYNAVKAAEASAKAGSTPDLTAARVAIVALTAQIPAQGASK